MVWVIVLLVAILGVLIWIALSLAVLSEQIHQLISTRSR